MDRWDRRRIAMRTAAALGVFVAVLYLGTLALLYSEQRALLFIGGRFPLPMDGVYRAVTIAEGDGTRLTAWEMAPAKSGAPTVVFFYGNAGTLSDFQEIGEALHEEGYGIVLASYRGYDGNPGSPSEAGLMADAHAVLASLGSRPVVIWGQSLGTGVAARMGSEGRCIALILQSPYTSIPDVAAWHYPIYPVHLLMKDRFDTLSLIGKVRVPVLIMSGTADDTVPHGMAVTLAARLGARATLVSIPGGGHDLPAWTVFAPADAWLKSHAAAH